MARAQGRLGLHHIPHMNFDKETLAWDLQGHREVDLHHRDVFHTWGILVSLKEGPQGVNVLRGLRRQEEGNPVCQRVVAPHHMQHRSVTHVLQTP